MSLPVSQYEALLAEVRGLRRKAQHVQQLANPLLSSMNSATNPVQKQSDAINLQFNPYNMDVPSACEIGASNTHKLIEDTQMSLSSDHKHVSTLYHGTWPVENNTMWNSEPAQKQSTAPQSNLNNNMIEVNSVMSFASSSGGVPLDQGLVSPDLSRRSSQQLEAKVDMVYSLLAMLSGQEHADMGETLLALSTNPESCLAMRQSGCIPLLVQMVQSDKDSETRNKASEALRNLIHSQIDEKVKKREVRVLKLVEHMRAYVEALRNNEEIELGDSEGHPVQTVAHVMKLSFDELHRQAICQLGGIHTIATLVEIEHSLHGSTTTDSQCILMRRYACMALTNLTFGDSGNKALLCSFRDFMKALVVQLQNPSDELRQVTASVLRNLSWRADSSSKEILREIGCVTGLMQAAMLDNKESTLKSILSALWNLSAHCTDNKSAICNVPNALGFLVDMLNYKTPSKSSAIIENAGGILRNISSQIAVREDFRAILRQHNCLQILLDQLKSPSLTIVSNACGTLWNLSAKDEKDQKTLWELGAPTMLRSLNHSKHKMIAMGSSAALKNLLSANPNQSVLPVLDATALSMDLPSLPTLGARKQKALLQDLDQTLSETYENVEKDSPVKSTNLVPKEKFNPRLTDTSLDYVASYEEIDFASLNLTKSSMKSGTSSLPYLEPKQSEDSAKKYRFLKTKPKKNEHNLEQTAGASSTSFYNNDKYQSLDTKLKEVSICSDEKDRCSIEDTSDVENHDVKTSSFAENISLDVAVRRAITLDSDLTTNAPVFKIGPQNEETPLEIDFADILPTMTLEELEKQDIDRETLEEFNVNEDHLTDLIGIPMQNESDKASVSNPQEQPNVKGVKTSGIPLPKSFQRVAENETLYENDLSPIDIDNSVIAINKISNRLLSSRTSTPIRINGKTVDVTSESCANIDAPSVSSVGANSASNTEHFNISQENNNAWPKDAEEKRSNIEKTSEFPEADMEPVIPEYPYPNACNFTMKDERDRHLERSCEESNVDNRMLDPDAMIESLERFTAELVSQASHLQSKDDEDYKNNTWNEDTSPNEITFPSVSASPNIVTFDSTNAAPLDIPPEIVKESNDFSSINTSTMTQSTLIAIEASKMATVFKNEADMTNSITSIASLELDKVQQPSLVESFTNNSTRSPRFARKKSLSRDVIIRKVLGSSFNNDSSLESLDNQSLTNLDQMQPPSMLGEVLDMDCSITSIASLPQENTTRTDFQINGSISSRTLRGTLMENVNPPSIFNEITDMCNSLADVATETEFFEDCYTHVAQTENDATEFSDANSVTPIQSDSSAEVSPKKNSRTMSKSMMAKQRRNLARDRYKTYTVAAEMVMKEEVDKQSTSDDFNTVDSLSEYKSVLDSTRFKTSDLEVNHASIMESTAEVHAEDTEFKAPPTPKLNIRRNFLQKRLENRERFKTQTVNEPTLLTLRNQSDVQTMVQREANMVLKSIQETKKIAETLDCETLSLVSNDDDSEQNSASSINYRTYHKSWGLNKKIPVVETNEAPAKPKIVKPEEKREEIKEPETEVKAIRGRRKALYSKTTKIAPKSLKPIKSMTSTLIKNVTSSLKSPPSSASSKPPSRGSSGYGTRSSTPKASPSRNLSRPVLLKANSSLERQGTFTKDDAVAHNSRLPLPSTKNAASKIPSPKNIASKLPTKSTSADRAAKNIRPNYARSTSADSREPSGLRKIQNSFSSQSLKNEKGAVKKSSIPQSSLSQRSGSNTSLNSNGATNSTKKQVTSKIASLWKKIEESKNKQPAKKDTRVWIQGKVTTETDQSDVVLRENTQDIDPEKRVSRLGSFIVMEENGDLPNTSY